HVVVHAVELKRLSDPAGGEGHAVDQGPGISALAVVGIILAPVPAHQTRQGGVVSGVVERVDAAAAVEVDGRGPGTARNGKGLVRGLAPDGDRAITVHVPRDV